MPTHKKRVSFKDETDGREAASFMLEESSDGEYATTVAAAAYAVAAIERERSENQRMMEEALWGGGGGGGFRPSETETNRKDREMGSMISRWFSGKIREEDIDDDETRPLGGGPSSMGRSTSTMEKRPPETSNFGMAAEPPPSTPPPPPPPRKKPSSGATSIKRTPSTTLEDHLNDAKNRMMDSLKEPSAPWKAAKPPAAEEWGWEGRKTTPTPSMPPSNKRRDETAADAWEREEFEKIHKRFEKLSSTIMEWEDEKKTRAKRKLTQKEGDLEWRRAAALQGYREEMARIEQVAAGARAAAEEKKKGDEEKALKKAERFRSTGRVPPTRTFLCC